MSQESLSQGQSSLDPPLRSPLDPPLRSPLDPPLPARAGERLLWGQLHGASLALAIAGAARAHPGLTLALVEDVQAAARLRSALAFFLAGAELPLLTFPDWETLPYDVFSPLPELVSERLLTLHRLPGLRRGVLVVPVATLMQRLPPRDYLDGRTLAMAVGERLDTEALRARLVRAGYAAVSQVIAHGEFAARGSLLDVFPMGSPEPYRIDLLDDRIDTIRTFDPETQRTRARVDEIRLLPAREFPFDETAIAGFRQRYRATFDRDPQRSLIYREVSEGRAPGGIEAWLPLFFESTASLFDYLPDQVLLLEADASRDSAAAFMAEVEQRYEQRRHDLERPLLPPARLYLTPDELAAALNRQTAIRYRAEPLTEGRRGYAAVHNFATAPLPPLDLQPRAAHPAQALQTFLETPGLRLLFVAESTGRRELLHEQLRGFDIAPRPVSGWRAFVAGDGHGADRASGVAGDGHGADRASGVADDGHRADRASGVAGGGHRADRASGVADSERPIDARSAPQSAPQSAPRSAPRPASLTVAPLEEGLWLPDAGLALVSETQLFGERVRQERRRRARERDSDALVRNLAELSEGDPVVHEEHGIGRYLGLQTLEVGGLQTEFLTLEYARGDRLYVPVSALHLISRYTGAAPENAPLHRLGGDQWEKIKRKAAERAHDVAAELLDIHARRAARPGRACVAPDADYAAFAAAFPFEETPDQQRAIASVLEDMAAPRPMDRVVCGDVGFGKTEVAMRAAFVAASGGRQVAVLVPTTLLAQQHFENFSDRFADWPLRVESLSRFRTAKEQKGILAGLADGTIDILVGTHKILQSDIRFKNLGLVIIDEEHRFGVRHKERLKSLRSEVDILTLTATPIPRTLNMALAGLRDLSIIATPPVARHPIKTFVSPWNDALVQEAVLRELRRGGQVYFLHNEVETIENQARKLAALIPEARLEIAHGQMRERDLERTMRDFYHRRFNLLLCSTIIESGIDVPSANTIVIERADRLGLAQLHQLRGRVGRSHHRAYAYLLTPPPAAMTEDARKRLEAIAAMEELGAGFTLATHDLEIRGAGELLGDEQSGQIHEVGFSLYMELLERAVDAIKAGRAPDLERPSGHGPEIDLGIPALLPADYVPDVHTRLMLYKRIAGAADAGALREIQVELIDRFGLLPAPAKNLFELAELKQRVQPWGIRKIEAGPAGGRILFEAQPRIDPARLIALIQGQPKIYKLEGGDKLRFVAEMADGAARLRRVREVIERLV